MLARTETIATIANHWLAKFERALAEPEDVLLKTLFHSDSHWRDVLTLHNQVQVKHLPYMPFPPNRPIDIPKDKLAGWFEAYVESMELNYWAATEFQGGAYNEREERWSVVLRRADGTKREMRPRHIVMATVVAAEDAGLVTSVKFPDNITLFDGHYTVRVNFLIGP